MHGKIHLSILSGLNVFFGFISQVIVYGLVGPGVETDALVASVAIPHMLVGVFTIALSGALIPIFSGEKKIRQKEDAWSIITTLCIFFSLLALLLFVSSNYWVAWLFPGFDTYTYGLCILLVKIQISSMVFMVMTSVTTAICYARGKFIFVEAVTLIVVILAVILAYFIVPDYGVVAAAWITVLRTIMVFAICSPVLGKPDRLFYLTSNAIDAWVRIKPMLAGNAYRKTDILVDRYLLSMGAAGELSLFGLAQQLYSSASKVFGTVFGVTAIPKLTEYVKEKKIDSFMTLYKERILFLLIVTIVSYAIQLIVGEQILKLIFGNGRVTVEDIHTLWLLLTYLGVFFIFGCVGVITSGAFYTIGDTKTPIKIMVVVFTIFIVIRVLSFQSYGVIGLCIAASAYNFTRVILEWLIFPGCLKTVKYSI